MIRMGVTASLGAVLLLAGCGSSGKTTPIATAPANHSPASPPSSGWQIDQPQNDLESVSCPTSTFCVAADGQGNVFSYRGGSWSGPTSVDPGTGLDVSCPTQSFCSAVDNSGNALIYDGRSWSSPMSVDPNGGGLSVSCPEAGVCFAVDGSSDLYKENGNVYKFANGQWGQATTLNVGKGTTVKISCGSTEFCMVVTGSGLAFELSSQNWHALGGAQSGGSDVAVSCLPGGSCETVDSNGVAEGFAAGKWSGLIPVDKSFLGWISCTSATYCLALDQDRSDRIHAIRFNGTSWNTPSQVAKGTDVNGVVYVGLSCSAPSFCMMVNGTGRAVSVH
jgi:hypothetical protein